MNISNTLCSYIKFVVTIFSIKIDSESPNNAIPSKNHLSKLCSYFMHAAHHCVFVKYCNDFNYKWNVRFHIVHIQYKSSIRMWNMNILPLHTHQIEHSVNVNNVYRIQSKQSPRKNMRSIPKMKCIEKTSRIYTMNPSPPPPPPHTHTETTDCEKRTERLIYGFSDENEIYEWRQ